MRKNGSAGGHNGLQDIVDRLGTEDWCRLRIGIGEAVGDPKDYVLSRFEESEEAVMRGARMLAADAAEYWVSHGAELAMTKFNGDTVSPGGKDAKED